MRASRVLVAYLFAYLLAVRARRRFAAALVSSCVLAGCVQLPVLDLRLRSTWRSQPETRGRAVELIAGVVLGWSGGSRVIAPLDEAVELEPEDAPAPTIGGDVAPCVDSELCRWESDERSAALERAGARNEQEAP